MKTRNLATCSLMLLLTLAAWGHSSAASANEAQRPLNLSLPHDLVAPSSVIIRSDVAGMATRNLQQESNDAEKRTTYQRYGTGFEARQRGMGLESGAGHEAGMGSPTRGAPGAAGMGGGRGGMGRGR